MSQRVLRGPAALSILLSLDARDAGERVLEHLVQVAELESIPSSGWIAGQAVATAIEALYLSLREPFFNDIDHFVAECEVDASQARLGVGVVHEAVADYGQMVLSSRARYWVQSSSQQGLINRVSVVLANNQQGIFENSEGHLQAGLELIDGFDFNCVQVGVDLVTRHLFWTSEFEQFIKTRQLEVVSMHTPAHTAVRLLKKLDEQPDLWCDLSRVMASLAGAIELANFRERNGEGAVVFCRTLFGPAIAARAQQYQMRLAPFFDLVDVERVRQGSDGEAVTVRYSTLKPRTLPPDVFLRVASQWPQPLYAQLARLAMRPAKPLRKAKIQALLGSACEGYRDAIGVIAALCGFDRVIAEAGSPRQIEEVVRFMSAHQRLDRWFLAVARSWEELLSTIGWIKRLAKEEGSAAIGLLEAAPVPSMSDVQAYEDRVRRMEAAYLDCREEIARIPARGRDLNDVIVQGILVRQLLTGTALLEEGAQMRHCVGGYTHALQNPRIVLLSLRGDAEDKSTWSTAHVEFWRRFAVSVSQHRGRFNAEPPPANVEALKEACDALLKARVAQVVGVPSLTLARWFDRVDQALMRARNRLRHAFARRRAQQPWTQFNGEEIPW